MKKPGKGKRKIVWEDQMADIVPYGDEIAKDGLIEWPLTKKMMNVIGFEKLFKHVRYESISDELMIPVIPLSLLVFTKISAYLDRKAQKDLQDILYVLQRSKTIEKYRLYEILGFIYYKIGLIVKMLLATVTAKIFLPNKKTCNINKHQLAIALDY